MISTTAERRESITVQRRELSSEIAFPAIGWTIVVAISITVVIVGSSFVLSFAALRDLASMAGLPRGLSWLWPVVVDGTILQATISVVAVSRHEPNRFARLYFWIVLLASATVSVCANGLHAFLGESSAVHPALAALRSPLSL